MKTWSSGLALHRVLILLAASTLCLACGGSVTVQFDVPVEDSVEIEGAPLGGLLNVLPTFTSLSSFDLSASQEFENNNVAKEHVDEVFLSEAVITATSPDGANLDFIDDVAFYVESPVEARLQVASREVPESVQTVELDIDDVDLGPYVRDESMNIDSEVSGRLPNEDTTLTVNLVFSVSATVDQNLFNAIP